MSQTESITELMKIVDGEIHALTEQALTLRAAILKIEACQTSTFSGELKHLKAMFKRVRNKLVEMKARKNRLLTRIDKLTTQFGSTSSDLLPGEELILKRLPVTPRQIQLPISSQQTSGNGTELDPELEALKAQLDQL